ncbi:MAG: bifunctional phosphoribosyl-AMP cyclohydrolase/phosphoribosyl-ATP diphosphatase HisIE [Lachnospiraceae bacterium]|nr:bifunctional phosphoribosyl-AMP cyclohydrolase/phosphoribosyl-ATP diphosphatase HisIE [Lachnospiraceae bacterium]
MNFDEKRTGTVAAQDLKTVAEVFAGVPEVEIEDIGNLNIECAELFNISDTNNDSDIVYDEEDGVAEAGGNLSDVENTDNNDDGSEGSHDIAELAAYCQNNGIDRIVFTDFTDDEDEREAFLEKIREVSRSIDIPFIIGTRIDRFEDVKKAFYTGAEAVLVSIEHNYDPSMLKEAAERFGGDAVYAMGAGVALSISGKKLFYCHPAELALCVEEKGDQLTEGEYYTAMGFMLASCAGVVKACNKDNKDFSIKVDTIVDCEIHEKTSDIMPFKHEMAAGGLKVNTFAGKIAFEELKTDANGLVPCIAQDYRTGEVLMLAYMNAESYEQTIKTGVMTYWSRSRQELWVKGATSGHYQYVRELKADCDNDTLLAKVVQIGAACHTGNRTCFFNEVMKREFVNKDISSVLRDLYGVVCDRKVNPKVGSYTNYLFNKGIDKILKKCGEEATEMVIAAKNPSHEELKYEIADLLYHMTVLMVECNVSWEEVATELANR